MVAGTVYHHGVEYALKQKMAKELAIVEEVRDIMCDRWAVEVGADVIEGAEVKSLDWGEDNPEDLKSKILTLAEVYIKTVLPDMNPVAVEKKLDGDIGGVPFLGYVDAILPGPGVVDHKFAKRRMDQGSANKDMQITTYACLLKQPVWGAFHQALDQKKPVINIVLTQRGLADMEWYTVLVQKVWAAIQTGIFPPNPLTWKCGPNCEYEMACRVLMED